MKNNHKNIKNFNLSSNYSKDCFSNSYNEELVKISSKENKKTKIKKINTININGEFIFSNKTNNYNYHQKNKQFHNDEIQFTDKIINLIPKEERSKYFNDNELNSMDYEYALKIDFRTYFEFYISLLKETHLIIFTFCVKNDYNIFYLKLSLFLLSFVLFFFMNVLFFSDDSMHKIYEDEGKYDFLYQIPQMLYSTIFSQIISFFLENLSLSEDDILNIKQKKNIKEVKEEIGKIKKCIKVKCFLFFIVGIILLFGFWYYISAFCAIYYNTQIPLIKDTFISFVTSMIYPFFLNLFPGIFRIIALKIKIKCFFITSKIITKIIGII